MFFDDHFPAHFHVEYGNYKAVIDIKTNNLRVGRLPAKQLKLVQAWAIINEKKLLKNFEKLKTNPDKWEKINPLK